MKGRFEDKTGKRFTNKKELGGYDFIIVEYNKYIDLWVEFQDEHKARVHTNYQKCKNGSVANPYHKSVYGVGCLGLMSDGSKPRTVKEDNYRIMVKEYNLWHNMIRRCYDDKLHEQEPSYKDAIVCDRWLTYANFLEDLPLIEGYDLWLNNEGYALDKDLKGNGSKVYSFETCCFITISENSKEANLREREQRKQPQQGTKIYGINIKTGEQTRIFNSVKEASNYFNVKSSARFFECLNGQRKTYKGYTWHKIK